MPVEHSCVGVVVLSLTALGPRVGFAIIEGYHGKGEGKGQVHDIMSEQRMRVVC